MSSQQGDTRNKMLANDPWHDSRGDGILWISESQGTDKNLNFW